MRADVIIVGAGLSGGVTALRLARAGMSVICLEQGRRWNAEDYPGTRDNFELAALGPWHANPNIRCSEFDTPIDDSDSDVQPMLFHGVGGSTVLYSAHWMRFLPSDFYVRSLDGVADDWPLTYADLAPFYDEVDRQFGVSGLAGDPAYPPRPDYPMPPLPIGAWGERVAAAHACLDWHWWPGANAIASRPYDGRRACVQRSTCRAGCNEGAKGSVDRTHWPLAEELGVRLETQARVTRVTLNASGRADGVVYIDTAGQEKRARADVIVLAANAIATPCLLMLSAQKGHGEGLANRSGLVGRRLMMHPLARIVGFFDEPMTSWQGHWGQSLYSLEFAETDPNRDFVRGAKWNLSPSGGPLTPALYPWEEGRRWGVDMHKNVAKWLGRSAIWGVTAEDLPDAANTVSVSDDVTAPDGLPAPKLVYRVSDNSKRMLTFMTERAKHSFKEAGAYESVARELVTENGWHPLGTCRMGDDPETSVVDRWNRCHDIPNMYIVDGSVFVTSSSVNPSATIAALALRAAEHIVSSRRDSPRRAREVAAK